MIPTIGILLCIYLAFKGFEILQIALCSPKENNTLPIVLGALAFCASLLIAGFFAFDFLMSGTQELPRLVR
jgi:hypothetical protein